MAIRKITAAAVKGIRKELSLDLNGRSVLFLGDNGTGKSSIEFAMRWALTGASPPSPTPSLDSESGARTNILAGGVEPSVRVEFDSQARQIVSSPTADQRGADSLADIAFVGTSTVEFVEVVVDTNTAHVLGET